MREAIETQHLDAVEFGLFDPQSEEFLDNQKDIETFIEENDPATVAKVFADSMKSFAEALTEAIGLELVDCYNAKKRG